MGKAEATTQANPESAQRADPTALRAPPAFRRKHETQTRATTLRIRRLQSTQWHTLGNALA
eukprot:2316941-Alexandrium_andersonii.AAC.1